MVIRIDYETPAGFGFWHDHMATAESYEEADYACERLLQRGYALDSVIEEGGEVMKVYELMPTNKQKSFYGKARVIVDEDGVETLISYKTEIMRRYPDGRMIRLWNDWSATTGRHIKAFSGMNKAQYFDLPEE